VLRGFFSDPHWRGQWHTNGEQADGGVGALKFERADLMQPLTPNPSPPRGEGDRGAMLLKTASWMNISGFSFHFY